MVAISEKPMPSAERSYRRRRPGVNHLYQGMTLDAVTGLHDERARDDLPSLGRWIEQTALRYINGANTYQFVGSDPVDAVDPHGSSRSRLNCSQRSGFRGVMAAPQRNYEISPD